MDNLETKRIFDGTSSLDVTNDSNKKISTYSLTKQTNNGKEEYEFKIKYINENIEFHLSWIPWLVRPMLQVYENGNLKSGITETDYAAVSIYRDTNLDKEKLGKDIQMNSNEVATLDIKIKNDKLYDYYIVDVLEQTKDENGNLGELNSRLGDIFGLLKQKGFVFLDGDQTFKSLPTMSDKNIIIKIKELNKIYLKQTANGTTHFKADGLVAPLKPELAVV